MKLCKIDEIKEGESLARAVFGTDYQILLADGTILTDDYIEKLKNLGIMEVYINDVNYRNAEAVLVMKQDMEELLHVNVKNILEKHTYSRNRELQKISQTADEIITNILEDKDVVDRVYDIRERSFDLYEHSISTCALATIVALKLKLDKKKIHDISVACLLHDIGLRYLNFDYVGRYVEDFNAVEANEYYKHPIYGYTSLKDEVWISDLAKAIILYHHEDIDGTGFPLKIKTTPLEARIVSVCDVFDEMICGICQKRKKVYEAIENLRIFCGVKYDEKVVKVILKFLAVYPVGSNVVTSEGETGIVIRQNKGFSDRPVIKVFKGKDGELLDEARIIDMMNNNTVFIEKVVE